MRRGIAAALVALVVVVAALGAAKVQASPAKASKTQTVRLGLWDATFAPGYKKIIAAFQRTHPGIQVKLEVTPATQYWTKLQTEAQSGQAPDIFWMNEPNFKLYQSNNVLHPISSYLKSGHFDSKPFPAALMSSYRVAGQQYGLPWTAVTVGLWYNKTLFDAAHVAYPNKTWTWANLQSAAAKLTDSSSGVYGIAAPLNSQENYYNTILQAGGYIISKDGRHSGWNTPGGIAGIGFWTNLIKDGYSPTLQQMTDTSPDAMFTAGKVAMYFGGTWHAGTFASTPATKTTINVTVLPKGKVRATTVEGAAYVMYAKTKVPDAAATFMQYLVSRSAQTIQAKTGIVVPARTDSVSVWVHSIPQYNLQSFVDEQKYARPYPASKNSAAWQAKEPTVLEPAWSGKQTPSQAAKAMGAVTDAALAIENKK